ncbi:MAG TPA: dihydrodipicolinate synthase family protein [Alphaproteobacteria bacterium]|nr:dihydrodipicolinate synthase family protein [Alphaproteobacteria bacterium]
MKTKSGFFGVYPMVYALFDKAGNLSRRAMSLQIEAMLKHKVHGIAVLGLASEVNKLSTAERHTLMSWVAEDVDGRVPLAVTVAELSIGGQIEFVKAAASLGAKWAILQPPHAKGVPESELIRFFGAVAEKAPIPLGIQNAPEYLGIGLSSDGIGTLNRVHPNISIVKLEATAIAIGRLMERIGGEMDVFNGRGGLEMTDSLRAGAVGIIPGGESFDVLVRIFERMSNGGAENAAQADALYAGLLPLLVFLMESIDTLLVYGKRVLGHRLGIDEVDPRIPYTPPTPFGLATALRYAEALGKF